MKHSASGHQLDKATITTSAQAARRLTVTKQHLAGRLPKATSKDILSVVRDLTFVQWDPIAVVAPSHILSLWNRVGNFHLSDLEKTTVDREETVPTLGQLRSLARAYRRLSTILFDDDAIPRINRASLGDHGSRELENSLPSTKNWASLY